MLAPVADRRASRDGPGWPKLPGASATVASTRRCLRRRGVCVAARLSLTGLRGDHRGMRASLGWFSLAALVAAGCEGSPPANDASAVIDRGPTVTDAAEDRAEVAVDVGVDAGPPLDAQGPTDAVVEDARADAPDALDVLDASDAGGDAADAGDPGDVPGDVGEDVEIRNGCPALRAPVDTPDASAMGDTWEGFARGFFVTYCTRCHASTLTTPEERGGAPPGFDWDNEAAVRMRLSLIRAAVGVDNWMPLNPPNPDCAERRRLVRWIDIGAP